MYFNRSCMIFAYLIFIAMHELNCKLVNINGNENLENKISIKRY